MMYEIILIRHGQSKWNKENRFTGWTDIDLSKKGEVEAISAAVKMKAAGYTANHAFTSFQKRAQHTLEIILNELKISDIEITKAWQLNERHYGALQGLNKEDTAKQYGDEQVKIWRRSYATQPPLLEKDDPRHPINDKTYKDVPKEMLPSGESLKETIARVIPYWVEHIVPEVVANKKIIISAHGNSLRALIKHIDNISDEDITNLEIPTGVPLVYKLDKNLMGTSHHYL